MGMAASQARFLGLTARLNNVEFEGQQINQQRTALSNKSASYYSDLLGMSVPVAPSVEEYTKTVYTFDDGALTNQITSLIAEGNGTYKVSYLRRWTDDFSIVSASPSIITKSGTDYKIGAEQLREVGDWSTGLTSDGEHNITLYYDNGKFYTDSAHTNEYTGEIKPKTGGSYDNDYYKSLSTDQFLGLAKEEAAYLALLHSEHSNTDEYMLRYVANTTTGEYEPVFYNKKDLDNAVYDDTNNNSVSFIGAYKVGSKERSEEIKAISGCEIEQDSTGRYMNISIPSDISNSNSPKKTYALTTNTVTDQDAYEDAMNQYEYDKALYDQSIAEINAKIEIVQAEDKDLELRLKQLDTEHNAIQTERDTVSQIIKKNVESSFKTFG